MCKVRLRHSWITCFPWLSTTSEPRPNSSAPDNWNTVSECPWDESLPCHSVSTQPPCLSPLASALTFCSPLGWVPPSLISSIRLSPSCHNWCQIELRSDNLNFPVYHYTPYLLSHLDLSAGMPSPQPIHTFSDVVSSCFFLPDPVLTGLWSQPAWTRVSSSDLFTCDVGKSCSSQQAGAEVPSGLTCLMGVRSPAANQNHQTKCKCFAENTQHGMNTVELRRRSSRKI